MARHTLVDAKTCLDIMQVEVHLLIGDVRKFVVILLQYYHPLFIRMTARK